MPVDVQTQADIARPLDEVAAFASDPTNAPAWYVNIRSVELLSPAPLALGSQMAFVAHFLGRRLAYTYEITEWQPGMRFVMRTAQGPFPMQTTYAWQAITPRLTRMTLRNQGEPTGFSALLAPAMSLAMRRANQQDLAKLKALLEFS